MNDALDLNLLLAFQALARSGSVTRAAQQMGITQPAMSNALKRLRETVGDPLFERRAGRLVATSRAEAMRQPIAEALAIINRACFGPSSFDPLNDRALVRLSVSEYWQTALLPPLLAHLTSHAPAVDVLVEPVREDMVRRGLARADCDMAIFLSGLQEPGLLSRRLFRDGYVAVMRKQHPLVKRQLTLAQYAQMGHVVVSPAGPWLPVMKEALAAQRLEQRFALRNAHVDVALQIVSSTNLITVVPRFIGMQAQRRMAVRAVALPVDVGQFELSLYWHQRNDADTLQQWMRELVAQLVNNLFTGAKIE